MNCNLCPRRCGADRTKDPGFCGADDKIRIARAAPHYWEEPCISGSRGCGAVFFVGCSLRCAFCQNREISTAQNRGKEVTPAALDELFLSLQAQGCHNLNLVTATPYADVCARSLARISDRLHIPVVWNTGGYETLETLELIAPHVQIFLPDFKYADPALAGAFSAASDYPDTALYAIEQMVRITGAPVFDGDGLLQRGTVVRHLVLPGHRDDSLRVLRLLRERFDPSQILLSLMWQYTPNGISVPGHGELSRRVTTFEYQSVADEAANLGFFGYLQEKNSAKGEYTPPFDGTGVE